LSIVNFLIAKQKDAFNEGAASRQQNPDSFQNPEFHDGLTGEIATAEYNADFYANSIMAMLPTIKMSFTVNSFLAYQKAKRQKFIAPV